MFAALLLAASFVAPAVQDPDAQPPAERGWLVTHSSGERAHLAYAAFRTDLDETLAASLAPGAGESVFESEIELARLGQYSFEARAAGGRATLELLGADARPLAQPIEGRAGSVRARVRYVHASGAESLQLVWKLEHSPQGDFDWEPLPSRVAAIPRELEAQVHEAELALRGRVLLEEKGCTNCHVAGGAFAAAVGRRRAPSLGPQRSFGAEWLAKWIADPAALHPSPDMPAMNLEAQDTQAIVAWLTSSGTEGSTLANEPQVLAQGRALYHRVGCVACHGALESPAAVLGSEFLPRELPAAAVSSPLGDLAGKWAAKPLADFLRAPHEQHADGRMPSLNLTASEADLVATYLLAHFAPAPAAPTRNAARPEAAARCAACHEIEGVPAQPGARLTLPELRPARGCLDPQDTHTPRYALTGEERHALELGLRAAQQARATRAPLDAAERAFRKYRCGACHARDGAGGVGEELRPYFVSNDERVDIGDEGRLPPDLSGVGFRLTTHWLGEMIARSGRSRPYLAARMPQFPLHGVGFLAHELARREGVQPDSDLAEPALDAAASDAALAAGRALMGRGAHACISCHLFKDAPSGGTPGPRLDQFAERLRYEWYRAYIVDPVRYKPGTRMPSFQTRGKSAVTRVLGGDFRAQADAMWSYFTLGAFMPPPPDLDLGGHGMQIVVGERPIVLRAFLPDVGPRAIAVGMPSGLHFAFDASTARLCEAWKGDFVDASGAWAGRGGNELGGRGPSAWKAPDGALLCLRDAAAKVRFHGYELDAQGLPTFLWTIGAVEVRETIRTTLVPRPSLVRELHLSGLRVGETLRVDHPAPEHVVGLAHAQRVESSTTFEIVASEASFALEVLP